MPGTEREKYNSLIEIVVGYRMGIWGWNERREIEERYIKFKINIGIERWKDTRIHNKSATIYNKRRRKERENEGENGKKSDKL